MKKLLCVFIAFVLLLSFVGCSHNTDHFDTSISSTENSKQINENTSNKNSTDTNILIAYFTMADFVPEGADASSYATPSVGNTETAALKIQELIGGDLFAVKTVNDYPSDHRECSAIAEEEMKSDDRPELSSHIDNIDKYDVVFIGYPIWWYIEPMAVRSFIDEYDFEGKTIIPFCTSMGADIAESEKNIESLAEGATVLDGITIRAGSQDMSDDITMWLNSLDIMNTESESKEEMTEYNVKIIVGDTVLTATLENNATTKALVEQMPMTLPMLDLYSREMCYRYGEDALPTDNLRSDGYEIGDIAYWPPAGSLVILYEQNGEHFSRQHLGHIDSGVEVFKTTGDTEVTFELIK